jgi:Protein of unknown function (DUF1501)
MLAFFDRSSRCDRRSFLRIGSLTLGGMSLPWLRGAQALAGAHERYVRDKSVVFLFMHGGPSQVETFDPKLTAPSGIHSTTGEVLTTIPGVTFGGTFSKLASLAHRLSVVRSFATGDANHDIKPIVGKDTFGANLGSIYARIAGTNDAQTGIPTNVALYPQAVDSTTKPTTMNFGRFDSAGALGGVYAPFEPSGGGELQQDMRLRLSLDRLDDRRALLARLDRAKSIVSESGVFEGMDRMREQAFSTILSGVADAFDLSKENAKTVARYDTAPLVRPENIDRRWNNYNNYVDNAKSLGKLLLLARRLCERGCGFVTITTNFVWDMHADQNNAGVEEGMRYMGVPFDHAVSAFIEDVHARGLSDRILLVCCGEMGRTPKVNKNGGRDHWGNLAPLLLSGGGLPMGRVIGQSTRDVAEPQTEPVSIKNLIATILHTLVDVGDVRIQRGLPRDISQTMTSWDPIPGII